MVALFFALCGCATHFLGDGSSVSIGTPSNGWLASGVELPPEGDGYVVPPVWRGRSHFYGTEELVQLLVRTARAVERDFPGSKMGIADLSRLGGGSIKQHRSHESGRDADIIFFAMDERGAPVDPPRQMIRYGNDGVGAAKGLPAARRFDVARNWRFVRALLEDPESEVQWIFVADFLRALLLDHAIRTGVSPELIQRAEAILRRPNDSAAHDDHMHIRLYCDPADRTLGCSDEGPTRWWKKHMKYRPPAFARQERELPESLRNLAMGPGWLLSISLHVR